MDLGTRLLLAGAGALLATLGGHILWWQGAELTGPWPQPGHVLRFRGLWPALLILLGAGAAWMAARGKTWGGWQPHYGGPETGARWMLAPGGGRSASRIESLAVLASILLAFSVRVVNLEGLPAFVDEAAYVVMAGVARAGHPWLGIEHGGKLLYLWLSGIAAPAFEDALVGARVVSAAMGGAGTGMGFWLARELSDRRVAMLAGVLYAVNPLMVVNDRMGYMEGTLSAMYVAALATGVAAVRRPSVGTATLHGIGIGLAALAKAPGLLCLLLPPALAVALRRPRAPALPPAWWVWVYLPAVFLSGPSLWSLRREFVWSFTAWGSTPGGGWGALWLRNGQWLAEWLGAYWTLPMIAVGAWAIIEGIRQRERSIPVLAAASLLPVLGFAALGRIWFPRYLGFATGPWLVMVAWGAGGLIAAVERSARCRILRLGGVCALVVGVAAPSFRVVVPLLRDARVAPLPRIDRWQYVEGWPSGYGLPETLGFLRPEVDRSLSDLAIVVDRERSSHFVFGLSLYPPKRPALAIHLIDRLVAPSTGAGSAEAPRTPPGHLAVHSFDLKEPAAAPALRVLAEERRTYILLAYDERDPFASPAAGPGAGTLSRERSVLQQAGARQLRMFSKPGMFSHYEVWGIGRTAA